MRLVALAALVMVAFAANSILNRLALETGTTGPAAFAAIRVVAGAIVLSVLVSLRSGLPRLGGERRWLGTAALLVYVLGFSFAYVALDAGLGALVLFGGVQITMFAGAVLSGDRPPLLRWVGSALALLGLAWLVWPGDAAAPAVPVALMVAAAIGWGVYSLLGRGAGDALGETAANFICAAPVALAVWIVISDALDPRGAALAAISGAITSGLGYALWYAVLPKLERTVAALLQLTVPVIAVAGGAVLIGEEITLRLVLASLVILGGVAIGLIGPRQRRTGSSGS